jgi:hypothetical protein
LLHVRNTFLLSGTAIFRPIIIISVCLVLNVPMFGLSVKAIRAAKVKIPRNRLESPGGGGGVGRGIALLFLDLGARMGWVVSTTPRPLYPRERSGTH